MEDIRPPFTLVVLPGIGGTEDSTPFGRLESILEDGSTLPVVTVGYAPQEDSMSAFAAAAWGRLDSMDLSEKVVLLGYSMGGFVTPYMYAMRPASVVGMVFAATGAPTLTEALDGAGSMVRLHHGMAAAFIGRLPALPLNQLQAVFAYLAEGNGTAMLAAIRRPVLVLHAKDDGIVPSIISQAMCHANKRDNGSGDSFNPPGLTAAQCNIEAFPTGGHAFLSLHRARVGVILRHWLQGVRTWMRSQHGSAPLPSHVVASAPMHARPVRPRREGAPTSLGGVHCPAYPTPSSS